MSFICTVCVRNFASSYNLKRHMETVHPEQTDKESETESNSESESESENEMSEKGENDESSENSEESEDSDNYTHDEVRAILRYALKNSSER